VGAGDEAVEHLAASGLTEVERDAALVGVQVEEETAALGMGHAARIRAAAADRVAALRRLDLHDVGAEVREQRRGVCGTYEPCHLEDAQAIERSRHGQVPTAS